MSEGKNFPYLHGFSSNEQERLKKQADFNEYSIFKDINFSSCSNILEVGCGVGAQTEILLRRFPKLKVTGIDLNIKQLETAKSYLNNLSHFNGRYEIKEMDATNMDFKSKTFDGAYLCWVLEHIPDPSRALSEVRRVLNPGAPIYVTEVMNHSFFLEPYSPSIWKYWQAFNDYQYECAGDPFIGAKLGNMLMAQGFRRIKTNIITYHLDNRHPDKRQEIIEFWGELLLSASDQLIKENRVTKEIVDEMKKELNAVKRDPNAVFVYSFTQAHAHVGNDNL